MEDITGGLYMEVIVQPRGDGYRASTAHAVSRRDAATPSLNSNLNSACKGEEEI